MPETFSGARLLHLLRRVRIAWFLGRALLGALYDISIPLLVAVSVVTELAALIPFVMATRLTTV